MPLPCGCTNSAPSAPWRLRARQATLGPGRSGIPCVTTLRRSAHLMPPARCRELRPVRRRAPTFGRRGERSGVSRDRPFGWVNLIHLRGPLRSTKTESSRTCISTSGCYRQRHPCEDLQRWHRPPGRRHRRSDRRTSGPTPMTPTLITTPWSDRNFIIAQAKIAGRPPDCSGLQT